MNSTNNRADTPLEKKKKPYTPPRLVAYGDFKNIVQGNSGTRGDGGPGQTKATCWIAEALYGVDDPRTILLRAWLTAAYLEKRRWWWCVAAYMRFGRAVANVLQKSVVLRRGFRVLFDVLVRKAYDEAPRAVQAALALRRPPATS